MWQDAGSITGKDDVKGAMKQLAHYIDTIPVKYKPFSEAALLQPPAPGKWSPQEILGHLIDSAINNLKRFTDSQFLPQPYEVIGYRQEELVLVNNYRQLPLDHLLALWQSLNRQIIYIVENIPAEKFHHSVKTYDAVEMKTLAWLICDYVTHMTHHWKQVWA